MELETLEPSGTMIEQSSSELEQKLVQYSKELSKVASRKDCIDVISKQFIVICKHFFSARK